MDVQQVANCINTLTDFLCMRDVPALAPQTMQAFCGTSQADVLILFGGSIAAGIDVAAEAYRAGIAKHLMLVGGEGHTTETLRQFIHAALPEIDTAGRMEADVMADYLQVRYGIQPDWIERASTNCGNNVTNALAMLQQTGISLKRLVLIQDASMQRRMDAGFRKHLAGQDVTLINYAAYRVRAEVTDGFLRLTPEVWGMWTLDRYMTLLMGEIPRLTDDADGYGPLGKGFIAHVDVPDEVLSAFHYLREHYGAEVRNANSAYAG